MAAHSLTVQETCKRLGISDSTCRRLLRNGVLKEAGRDAGNRILIDAQSVDAAAVAMGRADLAGSEVRREVSTSLARLDDTVADTVASLAEIIKTQEDRLIELAQELGAAKAENRMITMQSEPTKQHIAALEQELIEARRTIADLQTNRLGDIPGAKATSQREQASMISRIRKAFSR